MPDPNPNPNPNPNPAPSPQPSPAPSPQPAPAPQPSPQPGSGVFTEDYVRALLEEAASYRTRLRSYEQAARQALGLGEDAQLPQNVAEALTGLKVHRQQALEQATARARTALLKGAFAGAAAGRVVDIDDAFALASQELADAEVDLQSAAVKIKPGADGKQRSMADLVEALLTRKPHLKVQAGPGAVGGTTPPGGGGGQEKDEDVAKHMAEARKSVCQSKNDPGVSLLYDSDSG